MKYFWAGGARNPERAIRMGAHAVAMLSNAICPLRVARPSGHSTDTTKPPAELVSEAASISLISCGHLVAGPGFEPGTFRL